MFKKLMTNSYWTEILCELRPYIRCIPQLKILFRFLSFMSSVNKKFFLHNCIQSLNDSCVRNSNLLIADRKYNFADETTFTSVSAYFELVPMDRLIKDCNVTDSAAPTVSCALFICVPILNTTFMAVSFLLYSCLLQLLNALHSQLEAKMKISATNMASSPKGFQIFCVSNEYVTLVKLNFQTTDSVKSSKNRPGLSLYEVFNLHIK